MPASRPDGQGRLTATTIPAFLARDPVLTAERTPKRIALPETTWPACERREGASMELPSRASWKRDLAPYLRVDRRRSLGQIASVVLPYLAVWTIAALVKPSAPVAIALGLVATVFLTRMYSLFHDLTHNSMFESRETNNRWGHFLGFLLFTPYRWWQRQHAIHHAHTGDLEHRGIGEINTMTLKEYASASRLRRLGYRLYRNPFLLLFVGPSLVFLFERRFPQRGMTPRILLSVVLTNIALITWVLCWS